MKRNLIRTLVVCLAICMAFSSPALAILGLGDIVFDPSNFEEAVQQLLAMERQYEQLVQQYVVLKGQYDHMRRMAQQVPVNMTARYRALSGRGKKLTVVITAIARELAGFVWAIGRAMQPA